MDPVIIQTTINNIVDTKRLNISQSGIEGKQIESAAMVNAT